MIEINNNSILEKKITSSSITERLGLVNFYASGLPVYSEIALLYLRSLSSLLGKKLNFLGYRECEFPTLHRIKDWKMSGRFDNYQEKYQFEDVVLAATAEEVATLIAKNLLGKETEVKLYQISKKFRKEKRSKGLLRCREFIMKDAYSFHKTHEKALIALKEMYYLYKNFFKEIDLDIKIILSSDTAMGGNLSFEFVIEHEKGEGKFWVQKGFKHDFSFDGVDSDNGLESKNCIELGHIFLLGDNYSKVFDLKENKIPLTACSYGIGMSRLLEVLVDKFEGLNWAIFKKNKFLMISDKKESDNRIWNLKVHQGSNQNYAFTFTKTYFQNFPLIWEDRVKNHYLVKDSINNEKIFKTWEILKEKLLK